MNLLAELANPGAIRATLASDLLSELGAQRVAPRCASALGASGLERDGESLASVHAREVHEVQAALLEGGAAASPASVARARANRGRRQLAPARPTSRGRTSHRT
jgi:hypothetical protein